MERCLNNYVHDNPVPSCGSDIAKGLTTKTYDLNEIMKFVLYK